MCREVIINGTIWCDDHTDVYVGSPDKVRNLVQSQNHPKTATLREIQADCCDYLYFVCWSNDSGENGFIAQLDGDVRITTGNPHWQVYATSSDKDFANTRPSEKEVNSFIKKATCENAWQYPKVGQKNDGSKQPFKQVSGVDANANFFWYDSERDTRNRYPSAPYVPFVEIPDGSSHDEFLIFRIPVSVLYPESCQDCDCCKDEGCCGTCSTERSEQEAVVSDRANGKSFTINAKGNNSRRCKEAYSEESCSFVDIPKIEPCFHLHWGDAAGDKIEEHDTEIVYLTICNPYQNIQFKGLTITQVLITPTSPLTPSGELAMQIVPDKLIHFQCLGNCACLSREFTLLTRGIRAGTYELTFEYCVEEVLILNEKTGKSDFDIEVVAS